MILGDTGVNVRGRDSFGVAVFDVAAELGVNFCASPVDAAELQVVFREGSRPAASELRT